MEKEEIKLIAALKFWVKNTQDGFEEEASYKEMMKLIEDRKRSLKRVPFNVKFGPKNLADHYTCYYCGLADKHVEAGGMWWCPNFTCTGPGAHTHRRKLKSYVENADSTHSVDNVEWSKVSMEMMESLEDSPLKEAVEAGIKRMQTNITGTKFGL
jgi:hypothetical protein